MAELKRNFLKSKMNKDLDERLVPNGEYRDALNIEISTSEGSDVGSVQTLRSNVEITNLPQKHESAITVGSYADNTGGCVYKFIKDASNFNTSFIQGVAKKTGVRSDLIEKVSVVGSQYNYSSSSQIIVHDVYEVRVSADDFTATGNKLVIQGRGKNYQIGAYSSTSYKDYHGVRVGMEVKVLDLNGKNAWGGGQKVVVTNVKNGAGGFFSPKTEITLSSVPIDIGDENLNQFVYKFSSPRILNFQSGVSSEIEQNTEDQSRTATPKDNIITGVNVLDDYLIFTDNRTEPKKLNIERCILGNKASVAADQDYSTIPHTHLVTSFNSRFYARGFLKESHITTIKKNPLEALHLSLQTSTQSTSSLQFNKTADYAAYNLTTDDSSFGFYDQFGNPLQEGAAIYLTPADSSVELKVNQSITLVGQVSQSRFVVRITDVYSTGSFRAEIINFDDTYFSEFQPNFTAEGDFLNSGTVPQETWVGTLNSDTGLYEEKFIRFAYRFKYTDNELSCVSPYSLPAFLPGQYNFESKTGFNRGMQNFINSIQIKNLNTIVIPQDVKAVEFLFKDSVNNNVYSFKELKVVESNFSEKQLRNLQKTTSTALNKINNLEINIESENFGYTLPSDQITRIFDAVPIKAKSQEIQANRLMYGNYTEGYDMLDSNNEPINFDVSGSITTRQDLFASVFETDATFKAQQASIGSSDGQVQLLSTSIGGENYKDSDGDQLYVSKTLKTTNEIADINSNFNSQTGVFTAPETGTYTFKGSVVARIETRSEGLSFAYPRNYISKSTGKFKGNLLRRRHALAFGAVDAQGNPLAQTLESDGATTPFISSGYYESTAEISELVAKWTNTKSSNSHNESIDINTLSLSDFWESIYISNYITNPLTPISTNERTNFGENSTQDIVVDILSFPSDQVESVSSAQGGYNSESYVFAPDIASYDPTAPVNTLISTVRIAEQDRSYLTEEALVVEGTVELEAGDTVGLFMFTDQPQDPNALGVEEDIVTYSNASIECLSTPAVVEETSLASLQGLRSVKSERDYHLGVVYSDSNGRESAVLTSDANDIFVEKSFCNKQNSIVSSVFSQAPDWAEYYKIFIKETAEKYHNIVLDTALLNEDTTQSSVYLLFNSADRNKVEVGDVLSLKKEHGTNNAVIDKATWKILDIQGAASLGEDEDGVPTNVVTIGSSTIEQSVITNPAQLNGKFFVKVLYDDDFINNIGDLSAAEGLSSLNGAVFETKKSSNIDLDLYYEATQAIPIRLTQELARTIIKPGDKVVITKGRSNAVQTISEALKSPETTPIRVLSIDNLLGAMSDSDVITNNSGDLFNKVKVPVNKIGGVGSLEAINASGPTNSVLVSFYKSDGSYFSAYLSEDYNPNVDEYLYLHPVIHPTASFKTHSCPVGLSWFNCYSFGNGVESDTIKDDFNAPELFPYLSNGKQSGFKASLPANTFEQVVNKTDIIFSEIYNNTASSNRLNEFLIANNIVKRLNPDYGSIQKLFSRNNDLVAFCENKVTRILSQKNALFNADGNAQLLSTDKVLGQAIPFKSDFGISKNPESFAYDEYRAYFVDKNNGKVCRLSNDGITAISDVGMKDWFRDHLKRSEVIIGSFDGRKEEYNVTLHEVTSPGRSKDVYTVSFSETIDGWTSFKSFIPEAGYTLANEYYTSKVGRTYVHHQDTGITNQFYDKKYNSTITTIFNDDASAVKSFKSIAYEGTQSKVDQFTTEIKSTGTETLSVTDGNYHNLTSKQGWYVESINTDMQEGEVPEFIEKEGKWFNYIKGEQTEFVNFSQGPGTRNLDLSEFSVQGIGQAISVITLDDSLEEIEDTSVVYSEGFSLTFESHVLDVEGQLQFVDWNNINEAIYSSGLTVFGASDVSGITYVITILPNANYSISNESFSLAIPLEEMEDSASISNITFSNQLDSSGNPNGNVEIKVQMSTGVIISEDTTIAIPIQFEEALNLSGLLSTQLQYNIEESAVFESYLEQYQAQDVDLLAPAVDSGLRYFLSEPLSTPEFVETSTTGVDWEETGSYTVNAVVQSDNYNYLHTISIETEEGKAYIGSETSFNLTLIPSEDDLGTFQFEYEQVQDLYGNLYRINIHVYYLRQPGQESASGVEIILDIEEDSIVDYFIKPDNHATTLVVEEDANQFQDFSSVNMFFTTNIPDEHISTIQTNFTYDSDAANATNWLSYSNTDQLVDLNFCRIIVNDLTPLPNDRSGVVRFFSSLYPALIAGVDFQGETRPIQQNDGHSIELKIVNSGGDPTSNAYIIANPNGNFPVQETFGDNGFINYYEMQLGMDTGAYLSDINGQNIFSSEDWVYPVLLNEEGSGFVQAGASDSGDYLCYFTILDNTTDQDRSAVITVQHPLSPELTSTVTIFQDGALNSADDTVRVQLGSGNQEGLTFNTQSDFTSLIEFVNAYSLEKSPDLTTDTINIRLEVNDFAEFSIDADGTVNPWNLIPSNGGNHGLGYTSVNNDGFSGKPTVKIKTSTESSWAQEGDDVVTIGDISSANVIESSDGVSWHYEVSHTIEENPGLNTRYFSILVWHPQHLFVYPLDVAAESQAAKLWVAQPAGDLVYGFLDGVYNYLIGGYGDNTLIDLDNGLTEVEAPYDSPAQNPDSLNVYLVHSGGEPTIGFYDEGQFVDVPLGDAYQGLAIITDYTPTNLDAYGGNDEIQFSETDATNYPVFFFSVDFTNNTTPVSRSMSVGVWHANKDANVDEPDKIFTFNQTGQAYDATNNSVRFVNDNGSDNQFDILDNDSGAFDVKVIVGDYTKADWDAEVADADNVYPEGNKRPSFEMSYLDDLNDGDGDPASIDFNAVYAVEKNPNYPEPVGVNYFNVPQVYFDFYNNYSLNATSQFQYVEAGSLADEAGNFTSIELVPGTANELVVSLEMFEANSLDLDPSEVLPTQLLFEYTILQENANVEYFRLGSTYMYTNSIVNASGLLAGIDGDPIFSLPFTLGTHKVIVPVNGNGEANELVLLVKSEVGGSGLSISNIKFSSLGYTHKISVPHVLNPEAGNEYYSIKAYHGWNDTALANDTLNLIKRQTGDFNWVNPEISFGVELNGLNNQYLIFGNDQLTSNASADSTVTLRAINATSAPVVRFLDIDDQSKIYEPTNDVSAPNAGLQSIYVPHQITGFYFERFIVDASDGYGIGTAVVTPVNRAPDQFRTSSIDIVSIGDESIPAGQRLTLGVDHQRYLDAYVSNRYNSAQSEVLQNKNSKLVLKTGTDITDPGINEYQLQQQFKIAAFPSSPYTNLVDLNDSGSYYITTSAGNDGIGNNATAQIQITSPESLTWNVENASISESNFEESNVTFGGWGWKSINIKVPNKGAEYRVSFSIKNWVTSNGDGGQVKNKANLLATNSTPDAYPITFGNIDMWNGKFMLNYTAAAPVLRVGPTHSINVAEYVEDDEFLSVTQSSSDYASRIFNNSIVGNGNHCNIVRSSDHDTVGDEAFIQLIFRNHASFSMSNIRIEQVTDPYKRTLTNDPLEQGSIISGGSSVLDEGDEASDIYTLTQNAFTDPIHEFGGGQNNTGIQSVDPYEGILTDAFLIADLGEGFQVASNYNGTLQLRSINLFDNINTSFLAVSVDGGQTFLTSPTLAQHGISGVSIPNGIVMPDNTIKKFPGLQIMPNDSEDFGGVIGNQPTGGTIPRQFIFGVFDSIGTEADIASGIVPPTISPNQVFVIGQNGTEIQEAEEGPGPIDDFGLTVNGSIY